MHFKNLDDEDKCLEIIGKFKVGILEVVALWGDYMAFPVDQGLQFSVYYIRIRSVVRFAYCATPPSLMSFKLSKTFNYQPLSQQLFFILQLKMRM